jgi:hypothetical protein
LKKKKKRKSFFGATFAKKEVIFQFYYLKAISLAGKAISCLIVAFVRKKQRKRNHREIYKANRVHSRYLCTEAMRQAQNQQLYITFFLLSGRIILAVYCTLFGLSQIRQLDGRTNATAMKILVLPSPVV